MRLAGRTIVASMVAVILLAGTALAAESESEAVYQPIPPGTVITPANWREYQPYMTDGLRTLFTGEYYWKIPADFKMVVGPGRHYFPPPTFQRYTEKYSSQVRIVELRGGRHTIAGYIAGLPFPNPKPPMQGWKLLIDIWYAYTPYMLCTADGRFVFEDRFGNITGNHWWLVNRLFDHRAAVGVPIKDPAGSKLYNVQYFQITQPEQARYTALLTVYYDDLAKPEDTFLFIPALRRTLRLSSAARCSPALGSDFAIDDTRTSTFNGNPTRFDGSYAGDRGVLEMIQSNAHLASLDSSYYMPIFLPRPLVGNWEVRDSFMLDVTRVASERAGYCYGKKRLYIDKEMYRSVWADIYDSNMKLWKVDWDPTGMNDVPGEGWRFGNTAGGVMFDVQNAHLTHVDFGHQGFVSNQRCANTDGHDFTDVGRYSSVRGLSQILR